MHGHCFTTQYEVAGGGLDGFCGQLTELAAQTQGRTMVPQVYLDCFDTLRAQPLVTPELLEATLREKRFKTLGSADVMQRSLEAYGLVKRLENGALLIDPVTWLTNVLLFKF